MRIATLLTLAAAAALWISAAEFSPRPAAPFSILNPGAPSTPLDHYRGKIVLLAFIDTHCAHCQKLTTFLDEMAPKYAPRGVQVLECAFNPDAGRDLPNFLRQFHPPFPVGYSGRDAVLSFLQVPIMDTRPLYVPHLVFIDRQGTIRADYAGESEFMQKAETNIPVELDKLLKAPGKK